MKTTTKTVTSYHMVRVSPETRTRLKVAAAKRKVSMGELIHRMLDELESHD